MCTLYERIVELCRNKGVSPSRMCLDLGLSKSTMSDMKAGRTKGITTATAQKMSSYFGVSIDYLLEEGSQKEKPLVNDDKELTEYLEMLKTRPECRMLFQLTKNATKDDVEAAVRIIEALRNK